METQEKPKLKRKRGKEITEHTSIRELGQNQIGYIDSTASSRCKADSSMESLECIRKELMPCTYQAYHYQRDNYYKSRFSPSQSTCNAFMSMCLNVEEILAKDDNNLWKMTPPPLGDAKPYSFEDLKAMTCKFDLGCVIRETMHGRLFQGYIEDPEEYYFIIKKWDFFFPGCALYADHPSRFCNELELLIGENAHPCLMKLNGFCYHYVLAVVYEYEMPTRFLSNELYSGQKFGWDGRMKVASQLASLFTWLHERRFTFGTVSPSGIMIDEDFNIKVFDFGFLAHLSEEDDEVPILYPVLPDAPETRDGLTRTFKADVYIFGVLLVELITCKEEIRTPHHVWILKQLQGGKESIVNESLLQDNDELANGITKLAAECLDEDPNARPKMKVVFDKLSNLIK